MVYLHFPSNFTEEELMLQTKYLKLKKKKKALQKQKAPRPEPERSPIKVSKSPKIEARDAREVAKKLLKSGAIQPIVKAQKRPESEGFKRPSRFRALDRKPIIENAVSNYQPFSSSPADDIEEKIPSYNPRNQNLLDNFVRASNNSSDKTQDIDNYDKTKPFNTIFVTLQNINKGILQKAFSQFGNIVNISLESERNRGFVTFKKSESAERAIKEMDGQSIGSNLIKVAMAGRQVVSPQVESVSPADWRHIASTFEHKGRSYSEIRNPVSYDDDILRDD